ncbi:hypothetical protein BO78DRAFT_401932 [Aspergillus sclerotiicarbonarius CBS 121057]|uniref:Uncharacterized protein n=1 Tax=Aspergillus sclerotiicarbonarius (strain CBS 121057 / IBT 28362) TaxID=1448318 RepID=A0A319EAB4_ASPSB|nr:hypothetical protein BO78DRAFT_401932 [Aspergillus sclerotiicarbonarius CBS 121057]
MEASLPRALPGSDSSSDAEKPSQTRRWLRAVKRTFSFFVPRKIIERRQRFRMKKTNLDLEVPGTQAGQPMDSPLPTEDSHQEPDEPDEEEPDPIFHTAMEDQSIPQEMPRFEYSERNSLDVPTPGTGGRISICLAPGSTSSGSPAVFTLASPPPDDIDTKQTSPPEQREEFGQVGDDERSQSSSIKSSSLEDLSTVSTNSAWYIEPVVVVANNNRHKEAALMALDTQASANLMDAVLCRELGMTPEPCSQDLIPLQTESGDAVRIKPHGRVRRVAWHFAHHGRTHVSDFLVVDLRDYNAILGNRDIRRLKILAPGPGLGDKAR